MKIYTKTGDAGQTSLFGGRRVSKADLRLEAYGTVDELNAVMGTADALHSHDSLHHHIQDIQRELFVLGADLATPLDHSFQRIQRITDDHVTRLEALIDQLEEDLPPIRYFILPGGHPVAAQLHVARTVCRRAERAIVALSTMETITMHDLTWINRLSDALFVLARWANHLHGIMDIPWNPTA